jgi:hypothetical protein
MIETWMPVPGFEGLYEVRDLGRVWVHDRATEITRLRLGKTQTFVRSVPGRFLKPNKAYQARRGYDSVTLHDRDGSGRGYFVHRLVLLAFVGDPEPGQECRHLDGDPGNNRLDNLAWSTHPENVNDQVRHGTAPRSLGLRSTNTSGYKGVSWNARKRKWHAQIRIDGRRKSLGYYDDPADAARAYDRAALAAWGTDAFLNLPDERTAA